MSRLLPSRFIMNKLVSYLYKVHSTGLINTGTTRKVLGLEMPVNYFHRHFQLETTPDRGTFKSGNWISLSVNFMNNEIVGCGYILTKNITWIMKTFLSTPLNNIPYIFADVIFVLWREQIFQICERRFMQKKVMNFRADRSNL